MIDEDLLNAISDRDEDEHPAIARLVEFGRQKTYVTIDDILIFFPEAGRRNRMLISSRRLLPL